MFKNTPSRSLILHRKTSVVVTYFLDVPNTSTVYLSIVSGLGINKFNISQKGRHRVQSSSRLENGRSEKGS